MYGVPIGKANVLRDGDDLTLVAVSYHVQLALKAVEEVAKTGINVELIDLRSVKPLDKETILASVAKTGRVLVADVGWRSFGVAAEIEAVIGEEVFDSLKAPPMRITLPDIPAPASRTLEEAYYPTVEDFVLAVEKINTSERVYAVSKRKV